MRDFLTTRVVWSLLIAVAAYLAWAHAGPLCQALCQWQGHPRPETCGVVPSYLWPVPFAIGCVGIGYSLWHGGLALLAYRRGG